MTSLIYVNSVYFQQWKSDWEIAFPNSSSDSKLGFLSVGFRLYFEFFSNSQKRLKNGIFEYYSNWTSQSFPIYKRHGKLGLLSVSLGCTSKFFSIY